MVSIRGLLKLAGFKSRGREADAQHERRSLSVWIAVALQRLPANAAWLIRSVVGEEKVDLQIF